MAEVKNAFVEKHWPVRLMGSVDRAGKATARLVSRQPGHRVSLHIEGAGADDVPISSVWPGSVDDAVQALKENVGRHNILRLSNGGEQDWRIQEYESVTLGKTLDLVVLTP